MRQTLPLIALALVVGCMPEDCPVGQTLDDAKGECVLEVVLPADTDLPAAPNTTPPTDEPSEPTPVPTEEPADSPTHDSAAEDSGLDAVGPIAPDPITPDPCGSDASLADGECACDPGFDWCSTSPFEDDCCPVDIIPVAPPLGDPNTRIVTVHHVDINPVDSFGMTWDWGLIWTEVDPYFIASVDGEALFESPSPEDRIAVDYDLSFEVTLLPGQALTIEFWDDDFDLFDTDDWVDTFELSYADLQQLGPRTLHSFNVTTMTLDVQ